MHMRWFLLVALLLPATLGAQPSTSTKQGFRRPIDTNADNQRPEPAPAASSEEAATGDAHRIVEENEVEANLRAGDPVQTSRAEDRVDASGQPAAIVQWYGHAFVYVVSSTGVRVAIDPFAKGSVGYTFPRRLPADLVLVSNESDDHSAAERFVGSPQVFRSVYAVGLNRANGLIFKGVEVNRDRRGTRGGSKATGFAFEFDGVRYAHLGAVGDTLNSSQRRGIGRADVVFLGIGNKELPVDGLERIAKDLNAKIIVPITYGSEKTPGQNLRSLDEYLSEQSLPVRKISTNQFKINGKSLPEKPTVYVLTEPVPEG